MIRLRQVRRHELSEKWPAIEPELFLVLQWSKGYTTSWVRAGIDHNRLWLLEILNGSEVIGNVVLQVDAHNEIPALYIFGLYVRPGIKGWHAETAIRLRELARRLGCKAIRAKSPRRGWERIAEALGFEPVATEYEQEVAA